MSLSYDLIDSFMKSSEAVIHVVEGRTKRVRICAVLPQDRPPKTVRAVLRFGGEVHGIIKPGVRVIGPRMELEIKAPDWGLNIAWSGTGK